MIQMIPTTNEINCVIETLRRNGIKSTQIHEIITTAWGDILSIRRIQEIAKSFSDGTRNEFIRKEGSGRKSSDLRVEITSKVKEQLEENNKLTIRELSEEFDTSKDTIYRILKEDLNMISVSSKWVPHCLKQENLNQRIECAQTLIDELSKRNSNRYVVVTDEKWFYWKPLGNQMTRKCWVSASGDENFPRCSTLKRTQSAKKT